MLNVHIEQCQNGFIITDEKTGVCYVANKINSYSYDQDTVANILDRLVEPYKPQETATVEVI